MPERQTIERARRAKKEGKAPTTQAGEFVREEMEHVEEGKHDVKSRKQAIAIGLSKARRAGVDLKPPAKGRTSRKTRQSAKSAYRRGQQSGELRKGSRASARTASRRSKAGNRSRSKSRSRSRSRSR